MDMCLLKFDIYLLKKKKKEKKKQTLYKLILFKKIV